MAKLVRLKPYEPKKGHVLQRYTAFSIRFEERRGWYKVTDEVATYLGTVHQTPGDDDSPLAFDVCSEEDAQRMEAAEKKKAEDKARASEPHVTDVVAKDLVITDLPKAQTARSEMRAQRRA